MKTTTFSRKLDTTGRLIIPVRLREEMGMKVGREYNFYTTIEDNHKYICIDCGTIDGDIDRAIELLESNGIIERN